MNTVKVENCKTLFIGRRGENEVTEVVFDFTEWQEQFGTGVIDLYVKRNLDVDAYPVVLSVDGTVATWIVTAADTDVVGNGKIEFVYTVDQKVAKSAVFPFFVGEDIGESSPEPPEHYQSWLEQLTELGTETQLNAQAAAQSASEAAESAAQVAEDSNNAEAWAVGERNGEPVPEDDPTYNNNAKYWAENARANAPVQSVNGEDGDVVLTLDDIPNGETYARATPEQIAQIATNAENIASIGAIADTALQPEDLTPYRTAAQQSVIDNGLNSKINGNIGSIADINAKIPLNASTSNKLVDQNSLDSKLSDYRTAARQDIIDNNKQTKITANGILKGNGNGGVSAAVAGMDYLPTSALYAYRSANAQDAIDNAQNDNINKNTAALNTMQPAATAADIGKALIVKTVADGKPTSYEYGEAGGGGSALTAGDGIDITNDVISNTQGIEYIVGTQTAATYKWTGVSTDETLKVGKIIAYYLPYAGTSTAATLALTMADGTTTREISLQYKPNSSVTTQFPAGSIIILVYDGSYWRVNASYDTDTNTYPTGYCLTNGSVAAKAAACSFGYRGDANYFPCLFRYANTAADATLAITTYAPEAAPIYVNGARTSATNTFGAGVILFLYYNGAYYCYNDGRFPILVDGAVTSVQEYAAGLSNSKQSIITASGILKGDGAGGVSSAVAGTDYATPQQVSEKYTKPSSGIPSTDMTAAVQASLIKADTALQAVPDTYRTAADQDLIDNGKQAKITASGILKGDGAGGVSAAVAGVDYLKSAPVTSVNGQTGDVTIQTATDAQVTTAVNTWLGENVVQETGYVLDASLTMSNAAPPASAVGDLKSAFNADLVSTDWTPNITKGSYFKIANGATGTSNKYARTALWNGYGTRKAIVVDDPTYEFCLTLYDETGTSSGGGTGYLGYVGYTKGMSYIPQNATQFGVSFRRVDQAALTNADITAISAALSAFAATDKTLSVAGAPADAKVVGDAVRSGYVHDGDILRMSATPEAIPVNENHMGYNEFISTTWNTLLPTGYQDGDAYNASTTKIHGVKVERASSWTSTPYGTNVDTYTIYRYIFTPQNGYDKTLFLTSGCHGNEAEAYWSLYRLVRMIYFEGHKYPTLRNLRDCRLIIIPSWNPWGFQHYRRYNAFSALNTGSTDVAKNYQAWAWLMAANHQVTVNGTVYDISQVGEANVIWQTLQNYGDSINLWIDLHTDPYAGRDTSNVDIDDPRGVTPPYGCYGFSAKDSRGYRQLFSVMYDFYNILEDEYQFTETWHPQPTNPGGSSFAGWMSQFGFASGVVEISTFMDGFPYASGSAGMMKLAQEYYGNCIAEMLR